MNSFIVAKTKIITTAKLQQTQDCSESRELSSVLCVCTSGKKWQKTTAPIKS